MLTRSPHIVIARAPKRASRPKAAATPAIPAIVKTGHQRETEADFSRGDAADGMFQEMAQAAGPRRQGD
jgi:hypothetical protein